MNRTTNLMTNRKTLADTFNWPAGGKSKNNRRLCKRRLNKLSRRLDKMAVLEN